MPRNSPAPSKKPPVASIDFDIWGCRGSRNILPLRSRLGNHTSCYSLLHGQHLVILDAGLGLAKLSHATLQPGRFRAITDAHVLVTHAHVDHWEGLRDAEWFWLRDNGIHISVAGPAQALGSIREGFAYPTYVPLDTLALGTVASLRYRTLAPDVSFQLGPWRITPLSLNHYSGTGATRQDLDTLGYRLESEGGPTVVYLSDHEPTADTRALEDRANAGADLVIYDSHFLSIAEQTFGHGSIEHAARVARDLPDTLVFAGHLSARYTDAEIRRAVRRYGADCPNLRTAIEGQSHRWNPKTRQFAPCRNPR